MVALTCAEDGSSPVWPRTVGTPGSSGGALSLPGHSLCPPPCPWQVEFRIIVQVLNENDNRPHFQGATVLTHNVSEVTAAPWARVGDRAGRGWSWAW